MAEMDNILFFPQILPHLAFQVLALLVVVVVAAADVAADAGAAAAVAADAGACCCWTRAKLCAIAGASYGLRVRRLSYGVK